MDTQDVSYLQGFHSSTGTCEVQSDAAQSVGRYSPLLETFPQHCNARLPVLQAWLTSNRLHTHNLQANTSRSGMVPNCARKMKILPCLVLFLMDFSVVRGQILCKRTQHSALSKGVFKVFVTSSTHLLHMWPLPL